jgi:RND family efflux transporter MFP subunit
MSDQDAQQREALLKAEIARMKENLERSTDFAQEPTPRGARPTRLALWSLAIVGLLVVGAAFVAGWWPRSRRDAVVSAESHQAAAELLSVNVTEARRAPEQLDIELPGSIQAVSEAPILARADGYLKRRLVDIGDRVSAGQLLAEIEAPELDQQVHQARAGLQQAMAGREQASASLEQAKANEGLARVTAQRWANLFAKGAVSRQENDVYQAQAQAQSANVHAMERSLAASGSNIEAARANLARLDQMQLYRQVRAPFAGTITLRNVDAGALISAGQTLLFRVAQIGTLRTYVNVPQNYADAVRVGLKVRLSVADLPGRVFAGQVARTSSALDQSSRTLLAEIRVTDGAGALLPGMYCTAIVEAKRQSRPLIIPGDTLMIRPQGPTVVEITKDQKAHYRRVQLGRDFGKSMEVLGGIEEGALLVANPSDEVREGTLVKAIKLKSDEAVGPRG